MRLACLVGTALVIGIGAACGGSAKGADGDAGPDAGDAAGTDADSGSGAETGAEAGTETDTYDAGSDTDTGSTSCSPATDATRMAVVFDIDATLTTSDLEYVAEITDPSHDPAMRPDANTLCQDFAALGYKVFYVTARGAGLSLLDGTSATDATDNWLDEHGFPRLDGTVFLASGYGETGSAATDYKTGVLQQLQAEGYTLAYAYGNADTDIAAYQNVSIPDDDIWWVGTDASTAAGHGVQYITDADAYTNHIAAELGTIPCAN